MGVYPCSIACMVFTSLGLFFCGQNQQLIKVRSNGWSSTDVAFLVFIFFSLYDKVV